MPFVSQPIISEPSLEKARWYYQHENYEEALSFLLALSSSDPQSSETAYFLGMTYKHLQQFPEAAPYLEAAVTLQPSVKNAVIELIDLFYQTDRLEEAKTWVAYAEKESILPAQAAFLKGLILLKEGKDPHAALQALETAETLDPSLARTVDYQKAMANMQLKNYKEAKSILSQVVTKEPGTDLAGFANEYINILSRKEESERPFHGAFGYSLQYDDNVVFRPDDDRLAVSVDTDDDWKHIFTAQGDYTFKFGDSFGVKTGYSVYASKHNDIGFYNMISYDFPVQPLIYLEDATVAFPVHYNFVTVNERTYLSSVGIGNTNNFMLEPGLMLQTQLQYSDKDYRWGVSRAEDDKRGKEYLAGAGFFRFFGKSQQGFVNLRYALSFNESRGHNWDSWKNRFTFTSVVPFAEKFKWNFVAEYCRDDFQGTNAVYDKKREDNVATVSNLLAYQIMKDTELQLQHTFTYDGSSIGVYKYKKNIYGVGARYQF